MLWYFHQILIKENPDVPKKLKKLQEISDKYFYAERVVEKVAIKNTKDFWQKLLC